MSKKTMADVRAANKAAGWYFFDKGNMRFAASKIESALYGERYFITSEKTGFTTERRAFTIRSIDWATGNVKTVGGSGENYGKYSTLDSAREAIRGLLKSKAA